MKSFRDWTKTFLIFSLSSAAVGASIWGVIVAMHSPIFNVSVVEISTPEQISEGDKTPLTTEQIQALSGLKVGRENLFDLDLDLVERRISTHPWVRTVQLRKRFPQTLSINIQFRQPIALFQDASGTLRYIDQDGKVFADLEVQYKSNLPVFSAPVNQLPILVALMQRWRKIIDSKTAHISSVRWTQDRGTRLIAIYRIPQRDENIRVYVELGQKFDSSIELNFIQLRKVLTYLSLHSISAKRVFIAGGKKVVVKTASDS